MLTFLVAKLLFFPVKNIDYYPSRFEVPYEDVRFKNDQGNLLHGWYFPGNRNVTLLYAHGNAGNIGTRLDLLLHLRKIGWNIFIFDYRGYGGSEGTPSIEGLQKDTDAAYRWLAQNLRPEQIVLWGESLGGVFITDLAAREPVRAVILHSALTSLREIARTHYPFVPTPLVPDIYRSIDKIREIKSSLMVIHGTGDETVPFGMGKTLFEAAPHPKRFYEVAGGRHNDCYLVGGKEYLSQIEKFLNEVGL